MILILNNRCNSTENYIAIYFEHNYSQEISENIIANLIHFYKAKKVNTMHYKT